jgi:predicted DNA-binding transcriptional regulator AlpA
MTENKAEQNVRRCLREKDLETIFGCSSSLRRQLIKSPDFPKAFTLNKTYKVWDSSEIYEWIERRKVAHTPT